jgi:hypothetical protein
VTGGTSVSHISLLITPQLQGGPHKNKIVVSTQTSKFLFELKMTIITSFDLILIGPNEPGSYDAPLDFEFIGLELLDEDSTVSSYSDDDSTIESLESEYDIDLLPSAPSQPRERLPSRARLEELRQALESNIRSLSRNQPERSKEDAQIRRERLRTSFLDTDSLRLSRTRVPRIRKRARREQGVDDDEETSVLE